MAITLKTESSIQLRNTSFTTKDDAIAVGLGVFGTLDEINVLPKSILKIILEYIGEEASQIASSKSPFPNFIDLTDPKVLKHYLASNFQSPLHVAKAVEIAKRIYEAPPRRVSGGRYGTVFPAYPEVLAYAMSLIKEQEGEIEAWEIACANGGNGMLLAYAGAKQVRFNDIDVAELQDLNSCIEKLPKEIFKKCEVLYGNCLNLLEQKPEFANRAGFILCRNLLHFFTDKEQNAFLEMIKKMLKIGGQAIFTVNSVYSYGAAAKEAQADKCDGSSFHALNCQYFNYDGHRHRQIPCGQLCTGILPCEDYLVGGQNTREYRIYERDVSTKFEWQANKEQFNRLDPWFKKNVKDSIKKNGKTIAKIKTGAVVVLSAYVRMYTPKSLSKLFQNHGFNIVTTFLTTRKGHLVHDFSKAFEEGQQLGILVSKK